MLRKLLAFGPAVVIAVMVIPAFANSTVTFTFSGLRNNEQALNYFSGAYGSLGSGPGPNYGITFSPNAVIVTGAKGNLLMGNGTVVMNIQTQFANSFKLGYVALAPEVVSVWSGYDGTGFLLATMTLMPSSWCHSLTQCGWAHAGEPFSGTAASVTFSGITGEFGIGSIKLGTQYWSKPPITANTMLSVRSVVTPEPSSIILLATGLGGLLSLYLRTKPRRFAVGVARQTYLSQ